MPLSSATPESSSSAAIGASLTAVTRKSTVPVSVLKSFSPSV
jgi:hypothetical protein